MFQISLTADVQTDSQFDDQVESTIAAHAQRELDREVSAGQPSFAEKLVTGLVAFAVVIAPSVMAIVQLG